MNNELGRAWLASRVVVHTFVAVVVLCVVGEREIESARGLYDSCCPKIREVWPAGHSSPANPVLVIEGD
jgi:hypothetical protein